MYPTWLEQGEVSTLLKENVGISYSFISDIDNYNGLRGMVTQLVEHSPTDPLVEGSSPVTANYYPNRQDT